MELQSLKSFIRTRKATQETEWTRPLTMPGTGHRPHKAHDKGNLDPTAISATSWGND